MVISKAANLSAQYEKPFLGESVLFQRFRASYPPDYNWSKTKMELDGKRDRWLMEQLP